MDIREQVLTKYKEFNEFLDSISLDDLRKQFNRHELNEFVSVLYKFKLRSLAYDINQMTKQLKLEEFPQLLGVHRFPILREIDFMTEEKKIEFDKELVRFRVGNYLPYLGRYTDEIDKLEQFLLENGVIEKKYVVTCPCCGADEWLSSPLTLEQRNKLDTLLAKSEEDYCDAEEEFESIVDCICEECGFSPEYYEMRKYAREERVNYKELLKMKMERDKSLDNV
ncbi:hypothetical protein [Bacillus cereus]|uniref:Uncharacterized protein n=1 Tax=Bacillus cereus TaxID=1396 RepID=A0A2B9DWX1_BACCE|nr:hypothetical protein [Bacillus cereus]PGM92284.1 hypothetical protein CN958_15960 [Bacillus cereus]